MAKLILRSEDGDKEFSLDETGSLTVGRSPDCEIPISDSQASRRHCSVVKLQKGYEVADLGSTNGTLVNSTLIKKQRLNHGDVIRIGAVEIAYDNPEEASASGGESNVGFLTYVKGDRKGQKVELAEQRTTIGRKASNTLVIDDVVSSGYHCEIVRDLNGYTIRDLGSTNGTLVNGEMITESQLTHGARIRIGNVRFVFQDPAMAEIDLELASVEDDDDWGMMRDLDLAAVRKRNPATIVYTLLMLGIVAAGVYFVGFAPKPSDGPKGPQGPAGNLVDNWSFETAASRFSWRAEPPGTMAVQVSGKVKGSGKSSLEMRALRSTSRAFYTTAFNVKGSQVELKAKLSARGGTARLGLLWMGLGLRRWVLSDEISSGGMTAAEITSSAPPWATRARVGVLSEGEATIYLDDVSLVRKGSADASEVDQNAFRLNVQDNRAADLFNAESPILVNGRVIARDASGNEVDAGNVKLEATAADGDHIVITLTGDAATVGLEFEESYGYLSRGGFRAFAPGQEPDFHAAFPAEGELVLQGVRKILLGPSGRAFAVIAASEGGRIASEARTGAGRRTWTVLGAGGGQPFAFRMKTNLRGEAALAAERMSEALTLHRAGQWGEFGAKASAALAEFPFASKATRRQLQDRIKEVNGEYLDLLKTLKREIGDYETHKDLQDLADSRAIIDVLRVKFQVVPGQGPRGVELAKNEARVNDLLKSALKSIESRDAEPLLAQAVFIHIPKDEVYSAALLLSYIAWYLPNAEVATQAREELEKIKKSHPDALGVLKNLGFERKS